MGFEAYVHQRTHGVDAGHEPDCKWVDNHGPSCECGGLPRDEESFGSAAYMHVQDTMRKLGWKVNEQHKGLSFAREFGPHWIYIGRVHSGWEYKWCRLPGMTFFESRSFGTLTHALNDLWSAIAAKFDQQYNEQVELFEYKKYTGIYDAAELELPKNVDWVCPACGQMWVVSEDVEDPRCLKCRPIMEKGMERVKSHLKSVPHPEEDDS